LLVIDDPHSEQDLKSGTKTPFEQAWSWYQTGPRQRLMWGGAIIVVMTRWGALDLTAKLLDYQMLPASTISSIFTEDELMSSPNKGGAFALKMSGLIGFPFRICGLSEIRRICVKC